LLHRGQGRGERRGRPRRADARQRRQARRVGPGRSGAAPPIGRYRVDLRAVIGAMGEGRRVPDHAQPADAAGRKPRRGPDDATGRGRGATLDPTAPSTWRRTITMTPEPPVSIWPAPDSLGTVTDLYELTMMAGYHAN